MGNTMAASAGKQVRKTPALRMPHPIRSYVLHRFALRAVQPLGGNYSGVYGAAMDRYLEKSGASGEAKDVLSDVANNRFAHMKDFGSLVRSRHNSIVGRLRKIAAQDKHALEWGITCQGREAAMSIALWNSLLPSEQVLFGSYSDFTSILKQEKIDFGFAMPNFARKHPAAARLFELASHPIASLVAASVSFAYISAYMLIFETAQLFPVAPMHDGLRSDSGQATEERADDGALGRPLGVRHVVSRPTSIAPGANGGFAIKSVDPSRRAFVVGEKSFTIHAVFDSLPRGVSYWYLPTGTCGEIGDKDAIERMGAPSFTVNCDGGKPFVTYGYTTNTPFFGEDGKPLRRPSGNMAARVDLSVKKGGGCSSYTVRVNFIDKATGQVAFSVESEPMPVENVMSFDTFSVAVKKSK